MDNTCGTRKERSGILLCCAPSIKEIDAFIYYTASQLYNVNLNAWHYKHQEHLLPRGNSSVEYFALFFFIYTTDKKLLYKL